MVGPDFHGAYAVHAPLGGTGFSAAELASALPNNFTLKTPFGGVYKWCSGGDVDGALVDAGKVFAAEQADGQGGGEGITRAHGIHDGYLRGFLLIVGSLVPDQRAGRSTGEGDRVEWNTPMSRILATKRVERALIAEYRACIEELLKTLNAGNRALA